MFTTRLWNHFFSFMWDWIASGPTTQLYNPNQLIGQAMNADTLDDVSQWAMAIGRSEKPEEIKARLENHETIYNYGGYFIYRRQDWDQKTTMPTVATKSDTNGAPIVLHPQDLASGLTNRGAWAFIPDLWF